MLNKAKPKLIKRNVKLPEILWHHGTCNSCKNRHILICHFGYNQQIEGKSYRVCEKCLEKKAKLFYKTFQ